jgi:hypothetical protein
MCGPAIGLIGGLVSAAGTIYSGMAQSASYEAAAQAKEYEARGKSQMGSYESARQDERNQRLTGQQITATASSGVDLSGTPGAVIADSRSEGEMDKQAIRYGAQFGANLSMYESKVAKMNAKTARTGAVIGALAPVISGIGNGFG